VSIPVGGDDGPDTEGPAGPPTGPPTLELSPSREAEVAGNRVRRALPQRFRRTVGAWCFADHLGPTADGDGPLGIGPHPHMGLHTVTWLVAGELVHRDSLGSEQPIRPGQLNLMTAGGGVSHAEEPGSRSGPLQGIQLWVAQPERTRNGAAAFEHHAELPAVELGRSVATVLIGELGGVTSPARRDTALVGADLRLRPGSTDLPLEPVFEHALVVLEGAVEVEGRRVAPGYLGYLAAGRAGLGLSTSGPARLLLVGGVPFGEPLVMWWNFVGRTRAEMTEAATGWNDGTDRFGETGSPMARTRAPGPTRGPSPFVAPAPSTRPGPRV